MWLFPCLTLQPAILNDQCKRSDAKRSGGYIRNRGCTEKQRGMAPGRPEEPKGPEFDTARQFKAVHRFHHQHVKTDVTSGDKEDEFLTMLGMVKAGVRGTHSWNRG